MGRKCCVPNCKSGYASCPEKVSCFSIPKGRLDEWIKAIPRQDRKLTYKDWVCAKHFWPDEIVRELKTECYTLPLSIPRLKEGAVPSLFPNLPKYLSKVRPKPRREIIKHPITKRRNKMKTNNRESKDQTFKLTEVNLDSDQNLNEIDEQLEKTHTDPLSEHNFKEESCYDSDSSNQPEEKIDIELPNLCGQAPEHVHHFLGLNDNLKNEYNSQNEGTTFGTSGNYFSILWETRKLELPSNAWNVQFIAHANAEHNDKYIVFNCMHVTADRNIVVKKKMIVNEDLYVMCYVFEHMLPEKCLTIETGDLLIGHLTNFDRLRVCMGNVMTVPREFQSVKYYRDIYSACWRHGKCTFQTTFQDQSLCDYCQKFEHTVRITRLRQSNARAPKEIIYRRRIKTEQQIAKRLRTKIQQMETEIRERRTADDEDS